MLQRPMLANQPPNGPWPVLLLIAGCTLLGCASGQYSKDEAETSVGSRYLGDGRRVTEDGRIVVDDNLDVRSWPIGQYMAVLDGDLRAWSSRKLYGDTIKAENERQQLEDAIRFRAQLRYDDLVVELQVGPPAHRRVAAIGIGFSQMKSGVGPLLGALYDPDPQVVANALTGLGLLAEVGTPLGEICTLIQMNASSQIRNNAAYALQRISSVGGRGDCVIAACENGLLDSEPGVRVQCAITLGILGSTDSIDEIGRLLYDDVGLVAAAASRTLAKLGQDHNASFGDCARLLVEARFEAEEKVVPQIHNNLVALAGQDFEDEEEEWFDWARGLP